MERAEKATRIIDGQPVYIPLSEVDGLCVHWVQSLIYLFRDYIDKAGLEDQAVKVNKKLLWKTVGKIEKREAYYQIFHSTVQRDDQGLHLDHVIELDELKTAAIAAYWIMKYQPFWYSAQAPDAKEVSYLNQAFAVHFILSALSGVAEQAGTDFSVTKKQREDLQYAFNDWDLSREALMMFVEFVGEMIINQP